MESRLINSKAIQNIDVTMFSFTSSFYPIILSIFNVITYIAIFTLVHYKIFEGNSDNVLISTSATNGRRSGFRS